MIPASHIDLVTKPSFAHLATIGPDGEPQSTPVWIDGDERRVSFSQTTSRQKYLGQETYPYHQPGDRRVVVTLEVDHTTQMG